MARRTRPNRWGERQRRQRLLVVIDARETERRYLEQFRGKASPTSPVFKIKVKDSDPLAAVVYAKQLFNDDFDEAWCVFDQDDYADGGTFDKAIKSAGDRINLAVSCPSFELWLLLHFKYCGAHLDQREAMRRLKQHLPSFDKTGLRADDFAAHIDTAIANARKLDHAHQQPFQNPSTGIWRLVERLRGNTAE
jgi:hypothetical protein